MKRLFRIIAPATVLFLATACHEAAQQQIAAPQVTATKPVVRTALEYLDFTGNLQSPESVDLRARVSGYLQQISFKDGDFVKKGDVLFVIEPEPYAAKLASAKAAVTGAQADLLRAQTEYNRQVELVKQRAVSASDVDKWRAQRDSAQASLDEANANVQLAQIQYDYTHVTAPFDGRVDRHMVDLGNLVGAGEATLLTVIRKTDPMYAYFSMNEKDLARARAVRHEMKMRGEVTDELAVPIELRTEGETGYPHKGVLNFAATAVDSSTGSLLMRGEFKNEMTGTGPMLAPGMYAQIRMPLHLIKDAILIPEQAIGIDQGGRFVFVVNDKNIAEQRAVQVGMLESGMRLITGNLKADEWVVTNGTQRVRPGVPLNVTREEEKKEPKESAAQ